MAQKLNRRVMDCISRAACTACCMVLLCMCMQHIQRQRRTAGQCSHVAPWGWFQTGGPPGRAPADKGEGEAQVTSGMLCMLLPSRAPARGTAALIEERAGRHREAGQSAAASGGGQQQQQCQQAGAPAGCR